MLQIMFKPWEESFMPLEKCNLTLHEEEQSGSDFLVHLIQHNLNFSAAKPN